MATRTVSPRPLTPGDCIAGKIELENLLAQGGMGSVWVARNVMTDAEVAIKVLRPDRADEGEGATQTADRFRHEARVGATLAHRNITRVFDLLETDDGSLVLVMELLRGQTLDQYCKAEGPLTTREAIAIIVPILSALQHAHDHGIVHRDVKPSNIFLHVEPDGHIIPKLFDFGIAKVQNTTIKTLHGSALGTPGYMSPEQVRLTKDLDGRSDLFTVAVVLYEIITGQHPFAAAAPSAALAQVLEAEIDPDPRIDPRVWIEMDRALSKNAYERHASASAFAAALCAAVGESEGSLPTALPRQPPPARRVEPTLRAARPRAPSSDALGVTTGGTTSPNTPNALQKPRRSSALVVGALGGAALVFVIGIALAVARNSSSKSEATEAPSVTRSAPAFTAATSTPSASSTSAAPSESTTAAPTPAASSAEVRPASRAGAAPTRTPKRSGSGTTPTKSTGTPDKPVARTPGF